MIGYLIVLWSPWDGDFSHKKVFLSRQEATNYVEKYQLGRDEELDIIEVEVG